MQQNLPHIVIVGAGFGGLSAARKLRGLPVHLTIIDRHNYHVFQPLLYQVACAALSPSEIAMPIRSMFRKDKNVQVIMDEVTAIDWQKKQVMSRKAAVPYDYLILAPGSEDSYFGHGEWAEHAPGIKSLADAVSIRQHMLKAFEQAEMTADPAIREELTTFILIGGGPTGVEMAGAIAELARLVLAGEFRRINPQRARILLIEAGPRILVAFPEPLSTAAMQALSAKGVEVLLDTKVEQVEAGGVTASGKYFAAHTVLWTAGVQARPVGKWLEGIVQTGRGGRVKVAPDLSLPALPDVFVIGDAAEAVDQNGNPLPGVAPVAKQQGNFVAEVIAQRLRGDAAAMRFVYRDYGSLATIGRYFAIADFGWIRLKGMIGWLLWGVAHIYYLIGFRNRILVFVNWAWEYLTFRRGSRLIITEDERR